MIGNGGLSREDYQNADHAQVKDASGIKLDTFSTTKGPTGEEGKVFFAIFFCF